MGTSLGDIICAGLNSLQDIIYWVLFIGIKVSLFSLSPLISEIFKVNIIQFTV